ncbi:MAG: hypothetical protein OHK0048_15020 [Rhodoferax sp.]
MGGRGVARVLGLLIAVVIWTLQAAQAQDVIRIGVLAYRDKAQTVQQWKPLESVLASAIANHRFEVAAYTIDELERVVASRQVEFVLTNPAQYIFLQHRRGLQAPLATLLHDESGVEVAAFGGVIFVRADDDRIQSLPQIRGKTVAAADFGSLGAYQMQRYELHKNGLEAGQDYRVLTTGMPQDRVVQAVLQGQADVGFVRSGLLEAMAREGRLDLSRMRVLDAQGVPNFPVKVSTPLYPEWPLAHLSHVDEHLARRVAAALFLLTSESPAAKAMGIAGFSVPADYTPLADLLRTLREPPFDGPPTFTWHDVVQRYRLPLLGAMVAALLILGLTARLAWTSRQMWLQQQRIQSQQQALQDSESRANFAIEASGGAVWDWDVSKDSFFVSDQGLAMLGYARADMDGTFKAWMSLVHPSDMAAAEAAWAHCLAGDAQRFRSERRMRAKDGSYFWLLSMGQVVARDAQGHPQRLIGIELDVTARKQTELQMQLAASVFRFAREGITITDATGCIVDVNDAFSAITGYSRDEVLGKNPRILSSGRHDAAFYATMFDTLRIHGHWAGEVWNRRKTGEVYAEMLTISAVHDANGQLTHYVALFFDITQIKEHQRQLERIAHYDALTGLPNRVLLADRLGQALSHASRRRQLVAVVYLDLDGFKEINDTYGHDAGDQLLVAVAASMRRALRESDTLARLGGDEFVAVMTDLTDTDDCAATLTRLLDAATCPVDWNGLQLKVSASLGVTFFPQTEPVDADQLLRQADQAMYQAKLEGKNRYHVFDFVYDRNLRGRRERIEEIALGLGRNEFVLHYQPKVNLRTAEVVGAEALIRWQHPTRGLLLPGDFLPLIEDHELSVTLGEWVIQTALTQLHQWQQQQVSIPISVNVGARQLQHGDFASRLSALLAAYPDVSPSKLQIEILETSALQDVQRTAETIDACRALGVEFALDDFGTGYSSLTYLKYLPVAVIKVDQSFVRNMLSDDDDRAILQGVIGLAKTFGRVVVAEGVETPAHGQKLIELGCELGQGFGISRPMPAADLPNWVRRYSGFPQTPTR